MRGLMVTTVAVVVVGFAVPVCVVTLLWYLPVPRSWWSLAILVASLLIPFAAGIVGAHRMRRLRREIEAEGHAPHQARTGIVTRRSE